MTAACLYIHEGSMEESSSTNYMFSHPDASANIDDIMAEGGIKLEPAAQSSLPEGWISGPDTDVDDKLDILARGVCPLLPPLPSASAHIYQTLDTGASEFSTSQGVTQGDHEELGQVIEEDTAHIHDSRSPGPKRRVRPLKSPVTMEADGNVNIVPVYGSDVNKRKRGRRLKHKATGESPATQSSKRTRLAPNVVTDDAHTGSRVSGSLRRSGRPRKFVLPAEGTDPSETDSEDEYEPPRVKTKQTVKSHKKVRGRKSGTTSRESQAKWAALGREAELLYELLSGQQTKKVAHSVLNRLATLLEMAVNFFFNSLALDDLTLHLKGENADKGMLLPLKGLLGTLEGMTGKKNTASLPCQQYPLEGNEDNLSIVLTLGSDSSLAVTTGELSPEQTLPVTNSVRFRVATAQDSQVKTDPFSDISGTDSPPPSRAPGVGLRACAKPLASATHQDSGSAADSSDDAQDALDTHECDDDASMATSPDTRTVRKVSTNVIQVSTRADGVSRTRLRGAGSAGKKQPKESAKKKGKLMENTDIFVTYSSFCCYICEFSHGGGGGEEPPSPFPSYSLLMDHVVECHLAGAGPDMHLACPLCDRRTTLPPRLHQTTARRTYLGRVLQVRLLRHLTYAYSGGHDRDVPPYVNVYKCETCAYSDVTRGRVRSHVLYTHQGAPREQKAPCDRCGGVFLRSSLRDHRKICCQERRRAECSVCGKMVLHLKHHIRANHSSSSGTKPGKPATSHPCHACGQTFKQAKNLELHLLNKHDTNETGKELIRCDTCDYKCISSADLRLHNERHIMVECPKCQQKYSKANLSSHMALVHAETPVTCTVCGAKVKHRKSLREHMATVHAGKTKGASGSEKLPCERCGRLYTKDYLMKTHKKMCSKSVEERMTPCPVCGKKVLVLDSHLKSMHSEKHDYHLCQVCSQKFKMAKGLEIHLINKHDINETGKELIHCDQCDYKCVSAVDLRGHTTGNHVKVKCPKCFSEFLKGHMKKHMKNVHSETPMTCNLCGVVVKHEKSLRQHMEGMHSGERKKYTCDWCELETPYPQYLRKHMRERCPNRPNRHSAPRDESCQASYWLNQTS